jgi:heme oxygenase
MKRITTQRSNLFKRLSFYLFMNTETLKQLKENKKILLDATALTNKEIKALTTEQENNYMLPF